MLIRAATISDIHGSDVFFAFASRPPYSLEALDERVCVSGEGESPLGRAAWGGPRAWSAREGLRGAWIEKAQSGLALRGSALGLARDKTYAATLTASEDSGEWPRRLHGSIYEARGVGRGWSRDPP